jgi:hypothetical protein
MYGLNELSTYGTHPKEFDPEQIKPVLNNLDIVLKWYLKYKGFNVVVKPEREVRNIDSQPVKAKKIYLRYAETPGIVIADNLKFNIRDRSSRC